MQQTKGLEKKENSNSNSSTAVNSKDEAVSKFEIISN